MDYMGWGGEYLEETQALKARVDCLRKQLENATPNETKELNERTTLMYLMYLDYRETGRLLQSFAEEKGAHHEKETPIS